MTIPAQPVAIVGCGLIGSGWAAWFVSRGIPVVCHDADPTAQHRLEQAIANGLALIEPAPGVQVNPSAAMALVRFEADLAKAVADAGWIQENAPENVALKRELLARIDRFARPDAIIASSTSSIPMSDIALDMAHPERLVAGHPFLPVPLVPLVEVVGGTATTPATLDAAMAFYSAVGKQPIRLHREIVGHVANRLQAAVMREAFFLLEQGVASSADIDLALTAGLGPRWAATGPFISHDLAGGTGGAAQAFANLGEALGRMWDDLGTVALTPELKALVVAQTDARLDAKPRHRWLDERVRIAQAIQREKTLLAGEDQTT